MRSSTSLDDATQRVATVVGLVAALRKERHRGIRHLALLAAPSR